MSRPHQMRRHARRMRRHGLQPMVVINSDDPLPDMVAVLIVRWLWRYRSELGPLFIGLTTMLTAGALHATHRSWWVGISAITIVIATGLLLAGHRLGLSQLSERVYAAIMVTAGGMWLALGTAFGPTRTPLPQILLIGGAVLAVPWWAHRRRRARVRVERTLAAWPQIAQAVGLAGSRVMTAVVDVWGWRAHFGLARGQTIQDVRTKLHAIESALGTFRGAVRVFPTPDDRANRFELRVLDTDPHADAIPWTGPSITTITEPIDLGPFEDAAPARVLLLRRHALFGGIAGSGKSGGINVLMGNLSACDDVVIWAIDLKRGMELSPWAPCIDRLAITPDQARLLLRDAVTILEARASALARTGRRIWEPSPDMPALVIVVDEYAELVDDAPDATAYSDSIARRGRAVAVTLIAATQRPTQKAMGRGAVRSQMDVRICFRVRERKDVELILGQGMLTAGWHAHTLNAPGKFLISAPEHDTPRRARGYLLTDETVAETAARFTDIRPHLDEVSDAALARAHDLQQAPNALLEDPDDDASNNHGPDTAYWTALSQAPESGISVPELVKLTGMSRPTLYRRLNEHLKTGRVVQVSRGRYRATDPETT